MPSALLGCSETREWPRLYMAFTCPCCADCSQRLRASETSRGTPLPASRRRARLLNARGFPRAMATQYQCTANGMVGGFARFGPESDGVHPFAISLVGRQL